jgi:hypothetical protein
MTISFSIFSGYWLAKFKALNPPKENPTKIAGLVIFELIIRLISSKEVAEIMSMYSGVYFSIFRNTNCHTS